MSSSESGAGRGPVGERWDAYRDAIVRIELPGGVVEVGAVPEEAAPRALSESTGGAYPAGIGDRLHIITAVDSDSTDPRVDDARNAMLRVDLEAIGVRWYPAIGADRAWCHREASFAVVGLSRHRAIALGAKHCQDAIFEWSPDHWALIDCRTGEVTSMRWVSRPVDALDGAGPSGGR